MNEKSNRSRHALPDEQGPTLGFTTVIKSASSAQQQFGGWGPRIRL
ncbi:MAG: hypothetical protein JOZ38_02810, partial [Candidatus Eremiobacteraeota bacterium]|nr:hypothetical protein [Candidatus Eremiobacteraeota bacterium]